MILKVVTNTIRNGRFRHRNAIYIKYTLIKKDPRFPSKKKKEKTTGENVTQIINGLPYTNENSQLADRRSFVSINKGSTPALLYYRCLGGS
jgi:hypothetical protein